MLGNWKEKLSILFCRYFLGGLEGTRRVETDGFSEKVYLFDADYTLGLTTEWKHIFMNKRLFEENLEKAQRQIFLHEKGHVKSGTLLILLGGFPLLLLYFLGPIVCLISLSIILADGIFNTTILGSTVSQAWLYLSILTVLSLPAVVVSYIVETMADLYSLKYIEPKDFREAKESFKQIQPISKIHLFIIRLTHPSASFVLRVRKIKNKIRRSAQ
jgi:hypothetical protein